MDAKKYILVRSFCKHSNIDDSFIYALYEQGLVTVKERDSEPVFEEKEISKIERLFRLHHDLGINYEGLGAIHAMLKRMEQLQAEMELLRKRLQLYE